ncbi:MAG: hypothetical protein Q4E62_02090 [Sutterellaceae bacterium]|nr:hypothetical protein [Sutterellaceae bacterium]
MTLATLRIKKTKGVEYYLARFTFNGKRYEKSLGRVSSMTKDEAIKLLRTVKPSPSSGSIKVNLSEKSCPTFGEILEKALASRR